MAQKAVKRWASYQIHPPYSNPHFKLIAFPIGKEKTGDRSQGTDSHVSPQRKQPRHALQGRRDSPQNVAKFGVFWRFSLQKVEVAQVHIHSFLR